MRRREAGLHFRTADRPALLSPVRSRRLRQVRLRFHLLQPRPGVRRPPQLALTSAQRADREQYRDERSPSLPPQRLRLLRLCGSGVGGPADGPPGPEQHALSTPGQGERAGGRAGEQGGQRHLQTQVIERVKILDGFSVSLVCHKFARVQLIQQVKLLSLPPI